MNTDNTFETENVEFNDIDTAEKLGDLFSATDLNQSLHFYFIAAEIALQKEHFNKIGVLFQKAINLDPTLSHLEPREKLAFLNYNFIFELSLQIASITEELQNKTMEINTLKEELNIT